MKYYKYNSFWQFWWLLLAGMEFYNICLEIKSGRTSLLFVPIALFIISAIGFYKFKQPYIKLENDSFTIQVPITLGLKVQIYRLSEIRHLQETKIGVMFDYSGIGNKSISLNLTLLNAGDRKQFVEEIEKMMKKKKPVRSMETSRSTRGMKQR